MRRVRSADRALSEEINPKPNDDGLSDHDPRSEGIDPVGPTLSNLETVRPVVCAENAHGALTRPAPVPPDAKRDTFASNAFSVLKKLEEAVALDPADKGLQLNLSAYRKIIGDLTRNGAIDENGSGLSHDVNVGQVRAGTAHTADEAEAARTDDFPFGRRPMPPDGVTPSSGQIPRQSGEAGNPISEERRSRPPERERRSDFQRGDQSSVKPDRQEPR